MSILIKGLDIPKSEHERITVQIGSDGAVYLVTDFELKAEVYKFNAVEVPEPHGRLIDGDKMEDTLSGLGDRAYRRTKGTIMDAQKFLSCAPTVIEAEEQEYEYID